MAWQEWERRSFVRTSRARSTHYSFEAFALHHEFEYPIYNAAGELSQRLQSLPESPAWNAVVCVCTVFAIIFHSLDYGSLETVFGLPIDRSADILYSCVYILHVGAHLFTDLNRQYYEDTRITTIRWFLYVADLCSFAHYVALWYPYNANTAFFIKMACYYIRLHYPLKYLWYLNDYHLKGSVLGTLLKSWYVFIVMRVIYANFHVWVGMSSTFQYQSPPSWMQSARSLSFVRAFYVVDTTFLHLGTDPPESDSGRLCTAVMFYSGAILVTGAAITSLALIISVYLQAEETFRTRLRLIIYDLVSSKVPLVIRNKVKTFYTMYWDRQKGVSVTKLLPTYPPALHHTIYTDIYFEAMQKSVILRDLSYAFLSEVAKCMMTIHYIPGDYIIRRHKRKFAMIYISYGDAEMLTADDDETPMLRFTRGSILNSCGGCVEVAASTAHVSIRAATFCTAHILNAADLWRVAAKYGRIEGQIFLLRSFFMNHFERVQSNYRNKVPTPENMKKSTILLFKRNLLELKKITDEDGNLLLARNDMFLEIAGCYVMRNFKSTSLTEESDEICLRSTFPCILQPQSSLLTVWQCFIALLTLSVVIMYPYHLLYFKTVPSMFVFYNYVLTFLFIVDIIVDLSTGAKIEEGVPTTFTQTSSQQIKTIWFALDVLATAPIFEFVGGDTRFAGINKLVKLPKVFRLLKNLEIVMVYHSNMLRFISYVLLMLCHAWLIAALQQGYSCFRFNYCKVTSLTTHPFWSATHLDDKPADETIAFSLYWAVSLTRSVVYKTAEESKTMWNRCLFVMLLLEGCYLTLILVEGVYSATIMVNKAMRDQYKMILRKAEELLQKKHIDPIIRHRIVTYLQLCWATGKGYHITHNNKAPTMDLPFHVYKDIAAIKRKKFISCVPFMKFMPLEYLRTISSTTRIFITPPNEILLNTGDITNEIYVIKKGSCEVVDPDTKTRVRVISINACFGDAECLLRIPAYYTIRALSHVEVLSISRKSFHKYLLIPQFQDAIKYARSLPQFSKLINSRRKQFLFYEMPAPAPSREFFPLPRKHVPDSAFLVPFMKLGSLSVLRFVFPRFTIRPDGKYLRRYEWFRVFCAFLSANIYPIYTILSLQYHWLIYLCWFLDLTAYFDIFQRMLVGYFDRGKAKGILVYHPAITAVNYMNGAFLLDLLACLPLEYLDSVRQSIYFKNNAYRCTRSYQLLMYNRILQLYRLPNALDILKDFIGREDIVIVIKAMPLILSMLNLMASQVMEVSVTRWKALDGGYRLEVDSPDGDWLNIFNDTLGYNILETPSSLVLTTYFWVTYEVTTTGYNLFQPSSLLLTQILAIGMLFGTITLTYFGVRVLSVRSNVNQALANFQEHMNDMVAYMKREKISKELQREVVCYYEYTWDNMGDTDYRTMLKLCDHITLRTEAILHIYGNTFAKCRILSKCDKNLLRILGRSVNNVYFRKGTTIIEHDEIISSIYFVDYGVVEVFEPNEPDSGFNTLLSNGSVFGLLEMSPTVCCPLKFVSKCNLHLLVMDTTTFFKIIEDFPAVQEQLDICNADEHYIGGIGSYSHLLPTSTARGSYSQLKLTAEHNIFQYINAHSKFVQIYLIIISLLCVNLDLYNVAFQGNTLAIISMLYLLDVAFGVKIILNYAVPYSTDEETEFKPNVSSRTTYFEKDFKIDLVSVLPLEALSLICLVYKRDLWVWFSILRLNRVLRVKTIDEGLKRYYQKLSINLTLSTIFSVLVWFTLFVHSVACIWHLIGVIEDSKVPRSSWKWNGNKNVCHGEYFCSLFFVVTTVTLNSVSDMVPKQHIEVLFVTGFMLCSVLMYMIYVGQLSNILQYWFFRCFSFYSDYLELQSFLKNNRVAKNLVDQTNKYSLHLWRVSRGLQEPHFLKTAPQSLRLKIVSTAYMHHLTNHPSFRHCETPFLRHIADKLRPYFYDEDMDIVRIHEITNAMYFIHKGRVLEVFDDVDNRDREYREGQFFGTIQGLVKDLPYKSTFKTITKSQVLTLVFDDWKYLLPHYPVSRQFLYQGLDIYSEDLGFQKQDNALVEQLRSDGKSMPHITIQEPKTHTKFKELDESQSDLVQESKGIRKKTKQDLAKEPARKKRSFPSSTRSVDLEAKDIFDTESKTKPLAETRDNYQWPLDNRKSAFEKRTESLESITSLKSEPGKNHQWPLDNRKSAFEKRSASLQSITSLKSEPGKNHQWPLDNRKSAFEKRSASLQSITSQKSETEKKRQWPLDNRKSAFEKRSASLQSITSQKSETEKKRQWPLDNRKSAFEKRTSLQSIMSQKSDLSFRDFTAEEVSKSRRPTLSPNIKAKDLAQIKTVNQDEQQVNIAEETDDESTLINTKSRSDDKKPTSSKKYEKEDSKAQNVEIPIDENLLTPTRGKPVHNLEVQKPGHATKNELQEESSSELVKRSIESLKSKTTVQKSDLSFRDLMAVAVPKSAKSTINPIDNNDGDGIIDDDSTLITLRNTEDSDTITPKKYEKGRSNDSSKDQEIKIPIDDNELDDDLMTATPQKSLHNLEAQKLSDGKDEEIDQSLKTDKSTTSLFKNEESLLSTKGPALQEGTPSNISTKSSSRRSYRGFRDKVTTIEMPKDMGPLENKQPKEMKHLSWSNLTSSNEPTSSKTLQTNADRALLSKKEKTYELYLPRLDSMPGIEDYLPNVQKQDKKKKKSKDKDPPKEGVKKKVVISESPLSIKVLNLKKKSQDEKRRIIQDQKEKTEYTNRLFSFGKSKSDGSKKDTTKKSDQEDNEDPGPSSSKN